MIKVKVMTCKGKLVLDGEPVNVGSASQEGFYPDDMVVIATDYDKALRILEVGIFYTDLGKALQDSVN